MPWGKIATGILPIATDTCRMMLQKRSPNVDEGNTWGIVGGAIGEYGSFMNIHEFDQLSSEKQIELLKQTNQTEIFEEIGIHIPLSDIEIFYPFQTPTDNFRYYNMIGLTPHEFQPTIKSWESDDIKWVTLDELLHFKEPIHSGFQKAIDSISNNIHSKVRKKLIQCQKNKK